MSAAMTNAALSLTQEAENLIDTLTDFLDRETQAVQAADYQVFRSMQNDKFVLLSRYQSLIETLRHQKQTFSAADNTVIERLQEKCASFATSAQRNQRALESGQKSMARILTRIVNTTRETVKADRVVYGRTGKTQYGDKSPLSIKLNETL